MVKSGDAVYFYYNEDGVRLQKTATGTTGVTKYSLHGKNIVHLTNAKNNLHFFYDARNKPAVVTFNGTAYAYLYNLQGDVIALIDSNGKKVVEYKYDAWGRILSKTGTMASTLGTLNPFRYRGYVYDEETGLYYLRSRYYNPKWGRFINGDLIVSGNMFRYCYNCLPTLKDSTGLEPEEAFDWNKTTYALPDDQLSAEDKFFNENYLLRIAYYLMAPEDYAYSADFLNKEAKYDTCGNALLRAGEIDCSHLMYEVTQSGSITSRKRYLLPDRNKGILSSKDGKLLDVELKQGMEVFKSSGNNKQGHVGMLMLYDFGDGLEWAVFQSTSSHIKKSKALFTNDNNVGPNITSLFNQNGKCSWRYYIDPCFK